MDQQEKLKEKIVELKKDIEELEQLEKSAKRQKNKDFLSIQVRKLISELLQLEENEKKTQSEPLTSDSNSTTTVNTKKESYDIKIVNYAWDQDNDSVKFHVTLNNIHKIPAESIQCNFTPKSLELRVNDLDNKNYVFSLNKLLKTIVPEKSSWRVKTDRIIIKAVKHARENWSHVTEWEKRCNDLKNPPKLDDKSDPNESLMSLMKNMYDKGDDEMKRTIAKAWSETQNKRMDI